MRWPVARPLARRARPAAAAGPRLPRLALDAGLVRAGPALGPILGNRPWPTQITGDAHCTAVARCGSGHARITWLLTLLASAIAVRDVCYAARAAWRMRAPMPKHARRAAAENQLKLLESQLEPHMLFNTLANLRVLIGIDPPRAQAMLDRLIAFLRATLGASRSAHAPAGRPSSSASATTWR